MLDRYEDPFLAKVWSRERQLRLWTRVERAWMRQHSAAGAADLDCAAPPSPAEVAAHERHTRHEFVAFLEVLSDRLQSDEARRWLHYGLTSSDVIDTATAVQLVDSHTYLTDLAYTVRESLTRKADEVGAMLQVGRTHGQWAQPRPANTPLRVLALMMRRQERRLDEAATDLAEADFSGATGGRELVAGHKVKTALSELGLWRATCSTQILPRDGWAHWGITLANTVTVCEAIAEHFWLLAQSEVGEVEVVHGAGSSAMPHKRGNPHVAENLRGLGRMARHYAAMLPESIVQRGDRDLAHSSVERVALPDLCHLAATALQRTNRMIHDYQYAPERIEANLVEATEQKVDSALRVAELVQAGSTRQDAITTTREEINQ